MHHFPNLGASLHQSAFLCLCITPNPFHWPNLTPHRPHPDPLASISSSSTRLRPTLLPSVVGVPLCPPRAIRAEIDGSSPRYRVIEYDLVLRAQVPDAGLLRYHSVSAWWQPSSDVVGWAGQLLTQSLHVGRHTAVLWGCTFSDGFQGGKSQRGTGFDLHTSVTDVVVWSLMNPFSFRRLSTASNTLPFLSQHSVSTLEARDTVAQWDPQHFAGVVIQHRTSTSVYLKARAAPTARRGSSPVKTNATVGFAQRAMRTRQNNLAHAARRSLATSMGVRV
ncbi:hypothetical protein B0T16DRAFT_209812 [Cercophora newfieldiana]|uniref:Uncharacterized protein n=1 Tax=Cercophora newfieldiana TaxID=92897 RepID=A0AA39XXF0_9PEZI|nr:hypothetical protein B0T16DRAFT_209812 [Cercophora newfieldiana]